jgi:hypothetical protein
VSCREIFTEIFRYLSHLLTRWFGVARSVVAVKVFHQYRESFSIPLFGWSYLDHEVLSFVLGDGASRSCSGMAPRTGGGVRTGGMRWDTSLGVARTSLPTGVLKPGPGAMGHATGQAVVETVQTRLALHRAGRWRPR